MWTQQNPDYVRNCVCNNETDDFKSTFVTKVSFLGTYHWGRWSQAPPSSPPGQWEWTSVWAGPRLSWCPPTGKGWAQRRPCGRRTLRKAAWWSPPWCPGRCWTRWSCVNDWRSFHGSLQHPSKRGPMGETEMMQGETYDTETTGKGSMKKNKRKVELEWIVKGHKKGETVFGMETVWEKEKNRIVRSRVRSSASQMWEARMICLQIADVMLNG